MQTVVASGHTAVTQTGCEILKIGGNAFAAAVAAGFAAVVAEPALTSLGGGGFLLAKPNAGAAVLYDFFVDTPGQGLQNQKTEPHFLPVTVHFPSSDQVFNVGHGSVAVPGILRGLLTTHKELGRLPLHEILAPAVQLTQNGKNLFVPEGKFLQEGDRYVNTDLASFLETLPKAGDKEFYEGGAVSFLGS